MLTAPPSWALALTYWLHLFATVAWIGSLAAVALLVLPAGDEQQCAVWMPVSIGLASCDGARRGDR